MADGVPRRMMRYYRKGQSPPAGKASETSASIKKLEEKKEDNISPTGRLVLSELPSMAYEDLGAAVKKGHEALKNSKDKSAAEEMAFDELEKFRRKNKRLPNAEESEQIADNLYSQLKGVDTLELYGGKKGEGPARDKAGSGRDRAREKRELRGKGAAAGFGAGTNKLAAAVAESKGKPSDIKKLLEEETNTQGGVEKGEFDLGLDDEGKEEVEDIADLEEENPEEVGEEESKKCPNCKKENGNIIYCPKCGAAFCDKCAKKDAAGYICPKCGAKVKK